MTRKPGAVTAKATAWSTAPYKNTVYELLAGHGRKARDNAAYWRGEDFEREAIKWDRKALACRLAIKALRTDATKGRSR